MTPRLNFESLGRAGIVHGASALALEPLVLQTLLDHIPMRATAVGRDERYRYANRAFLDAMGLRAEQVIGRHVAEVLGEAMYQAYLPVAERLFGGESLRWEGWMDYRGRGARYDEQTLLPYATDGRAVDAIITFGRDVTELKQREAELAAKVAELEATEALKSAIVDHALAALVSADADGRVVEFNPAAEQMFGVSRVQALGRPVGELIVPARHRARHDAGMARMKAGAAPHIMGRRVEMEALRADGSEFPVEMVLWRTEVGGVAHYTASMYDLSERRAQAEEIARQRDALRQSEKMTAMGSLLAGVAHELNNPMAIVMGRAALLESKCSDPALRADATRIREAAERCGRIVRTFLGMARQKERHVEPVQVNDMVRGAVDLLQYNLRTSGVDLTLQLAEGLPAVTADPDQLGQVLLNLLVNAQQALAAQPAPRRVAIHTGALRAGDGTAAGVWLRVADNGPGVPAALRDRIFDPFFTTKPEGMGTGLGLGVSRSLVREAGGDLVLEATGATGGASFRCWLPLSADGAAVAVARAPVAIETTPVRARVLVVDDEPELAALMQEMLEAADLEVAIAESGAVALALVDEARFDAVVSDLRMPELDGPGLWRALRERHPALAARMVFVTGDTLSPSAREFLQATGCACLEKPFAPADLLARVQAALASAIG
ncbi:MAG TPA: PAS domain S-box protein [Methylibium sp.]|nr:PAS domain S-box protein [Methylibium sp.]